jgi:geranylgeranyl diphosphate synthase type II
MDLNAYLNDCRGLVLEEICRIIPADRRYQSILYDLMLDYPLREGKALRPALCIAVCRALGGKLESVVRSAAVLELYHNAFLIHDDIEDESLMRRGSPTLQRQHGVPIAVNVGDAMLALTLKPLLDNIGVMGLGPALRILDAVSRMVQESVHGQAVELDWVRRSEWDIDEEDYVRMVVLKTGWYSFITPVLIGGIAAKRDPEQLNELAEFARLLSVAFQIQDDVLNLDGDVTGYGKEIGGDLWEGKRTVVLLHLMRNADEAERAEVRRILELPRPADPSTNGKNNGHGTISEDLLGQMVSARQLTKKGRELLRQAMRNGNGNGTHYKTAGEIELLMSLIRRHGSIEYARGVARRWTDDARAQLEKCSAWMIPSVHRGVLEELVAYVNSRLR